MKLLDNSANIVISPPLAGTSQFLYLSLKESLKSKIPVLIILTDKSPEDFKKDLLKNKMFIGANEAQENLMFVDCYSRNTGGDVKDSNSIKRVSGPLAMNEISIAVSEAERKFIKKSEKHLVILDSLSTLLMYSNPQAVGRFIQVLIAKIRQAGGSVIFTLEEGMHDEKVMVTIEHLMNSIIHVKLSDGKVLVKASGISGFEDWTSPA